MKILIVDDHPLMADGVASALELQTDKSIVGKVANGKEALKFLSKNEVDLVMMDISMPEMDGLECTAIIKERFPATKVIMLTMHDDYATVTKVTESGADGYLLKNTGVKEMEKALRRIQEGHVYYTDRMAELLLNPPAAPQRQTDNVSKDILTKRELQIVGLIASAYSNAEIAEQLFISEATVQTHRRNLMQKLGMKNTADLVRWAIKENVI